MPKPNSTIVYFARCGESGPIKIGVSNTGGLISRLTSIQVGCPDFLWLIARIPRAHILLEASLHLHFADIRVRGEWFRHEPSLLTWIAEYAEVFHPPAICTPSVLARETPAPAKSKVPWRIVAAYKAGSFQRKNPYDRLRLCECGTQFWSPDNRYCPQCERAKRIEMDVKGFLRDYTGSWARR